MYCHGIPGAGKTLLTSIIIDAMKGYTQEVSLEVRQPVAYIYFNYQDSTIQTLPNIVGYIVAQAVQNQTGIPPALKALYDVHSKKRTRPSFAELKNLFDKLCQKGLIFDLILDALDEYPNPEAILNLLSELDHYIVSILVTSRPHIAVD